MSGRRPVTEVLIAVKKFKRDRKCDEKFFIAIAGCRFVNRGTVNYPRRGCTTYSKSFSPAWVPGPIEQTLAEIF
jgi:hypothetical protein